MRKEKIDFNVALADAFGEAIKEPVKKTVGGKQDVEMVSVMLNRSLINALGHPAAIPEDKSYNAESIVNRLLLQQKIACKEPQIYSTDELGVIRETVVTLFNKKAASVEFVGTILKMTE